MRLSSQEQALVTAIVRGLPPSAAAETCGMGRAEVRAVLRKPRVAEAIAIQRRAIETKLGMAVTRENLTLMLFEAHRKAGTATEEVMAIREIGKLNGLYAPDTVVHTHANLTRVEQMEGMPDAELAALAYSEGETIDGDTVPDADYLADLDDGEETGE